MANRPKSKEPIKALRKSKEPTKQIRALLVEHLGSDAAADAWLDSTDTGYPTTARDAIEAGDAKFVLSDLESQWGPSPSYA